MGELVHFIISAQNSISSVQEEVLGLPVVFAFNVYTGNL